MDVSIISINYNQSQLTLDFVKSIIKHTSKNIDYEIIIVDNCSQKKDFLNLKKILANFTEIKIVRSIINTGFGGGNMFGAQFASGKYLAFINNDVIFTEDCFSSLINLFKNDNKIAVATPQQYDGNNTPIISFDHFVGIRKEFLGRNFLERTSNKIKRENKHYKQTITVDFIQGSFMFFDAKKFAEVGGFDNNIFFYYEEMDLCLRLKKKGYTSVVHPETSFIHLHGKSTKKSYLVDRELRLSKFYTCRKNLNYFKYNLIRVFNLIGFLLKSFVKPQYFNLVLILLTGKYSENSLKQKQQIVFMKHSD